MPSGIFPNDEWSFCQGEIGGQSALLRVRSTLPSQVDIDLFPQLMILTWRYDENANNGLPSSDLVEQMAEFEDCVLEACDDEKWWGSGVAVLTLPGAREWRFYTSDPQVFLNEFSRVLSGKGPYPLEIQTFFDDEWTALRELQP